MGQKISKEVRKYFELNGKKNVAYQNLDNELKTVFREKFVAITVILGGGCLKSVIFSNKQKQRKLSPKQRKKKIERLEERDLRLKSKHRVVVALWTESAYSLLTGKSALEVKL